MARLLFRGDLLTARPSAKGTIARVLTAQVPAAYPANLNDLTALYADIETAEGAPRPAGGAFRVDSSGRLPRFLGPDGVSTLFVLYDDGPPYTAVTITGVTDPADAGTGTSSALTPTATKTAAYTAAVGDLAMMNVAGGGTALALPAAPADKAQVGYRAIGATAAVPLVVTAGGSDTIGLLGATSANIVLAEEVGVLQYQASSGRWTAVANVKSLASLLTEQVNVVAAAGAAQTIPDPAAGVTVNAYTLTANCTFTMPSLSATGQAKSFTVRLTQDGTGSRTATFTGALWGVGAAPILSTGAGKVDLLTFISISGSAYVGGVVGLDVR